MLKFSPGAKALSDKFASGLEPRMAPHGRLDFIADRAAKLHGAVARIAGVFHMVENIYSIGTVYSIDTIISEKNFKRAKELGRYLIEHAKAAFTTIGGNGEVNDAKYILRWLEKTQLERFSKRDAHNALQERFKTVDSIEPALNILENHDYIQELPADRQEGRGRRPSSVFAVNPLSTQNTKNTQFSGKSNSVHSVNTVPADQKQKTQEEYEHNNLLEGEL